MGADVAQERTLNSPTPPRCEQNGVGRPTVVAVSDCARPPVLMNVSDFCRMVQQQTLTREQSYGEEDSTDYADRDEQLLRPLTFSHACLDIRGPLGLERL